MTKVDDMVRKVAVSLNLLDATGGLIPLDSLMIVDFVIAFEQTAGVTIPANKMDAENFLSLESVAAALADVEAVGS